MKVIRGWRGKGKWGPGRGGSQRTAGGGSLLLLLPRGRQPRRRQDPLCVPAGGRLGKRPGAENRRSEEICRGAKTPKDAGATAARTAHPVVSQGGARP